MDGGDKGGVGGAKVVQLCSYLAWCLPTSPVNEWFRTIYEPLFYHYGVDLVINGHVHSEPCWRDMSVLLAMVLGSNAGQARDAGYGCIAGMASC